MVRKEEYNGHECHQVLWAYSLVECMYCSRVFGSKDNAVLEPCPGRPKKGRQKRLEEAGE